MLSTDDDVKYRKSHNVLEDKDERCLCLGE